MNKQNGDGEDLYNIKKLNATFAISSLIVLIAIVGMVWADYAREWKVWQRAFNDLEIARTERAIAQADSAIDKTQLQQLEDSLKVVNDQLTQRQSDIDAVQKHVNSLAAQWYKVDQVARFAKATSDAQKYEYEKAAQIDSVGAQKRREQLDQALAKLADLNEQVKQVAAQRDSAEVSLTQLTADREQIQKRIANLELSRTRLEKKLASISRFNLSTLLSKDAGRILSGLINDFFRNQPLVDFINPSLRIQQVVVDNIRENINFSTIPKVDRCMTCHLPIDKPGYEDEQQPFKSHPNLALFLDARSPHPMAKFGCTSCHLGRGRGTTFASVTHTPRDAQQAEEWEHAYDWEHIEHWDDPMMPAEYTEAGCLHCHRGVVEVSQADRLSRGLELVEQLGCWGCHKIQGQGFEGLRKVGPDLTHISAKVTKDWAFKWVRDPKGFRPTTRMPKFFNQTNTNTPEYRTRNDAEVAAIVEYLFKNSESMDFPPPPAKGDPGRGQALVETAGCRGCHVGGEGDEAGPGEQRRLFGPNLNKVGSKVSAAWLYNWVKNPKAYFPKTKMPNLRLTDQEAADVTAYLLTLQGSFPDETLPPMNTQVLDEIAIEFLAQQMPKNQAQAQLARMAAEEKPLFVGERLINRYGCFGCHVIKGSENAQPIGTELSNEGNKIVEQLDFGFIKLDRTRPSWFFQKLKDPRIFDLGVVKRPDEKLKMPNFGLGAEDAKALVTVLLGLRDDPIRMEARKNLSRREADAADGMKLIKYYNCQGCHLLNGKGRDIAPSVTKLMVAQGRNEADVQAFLPPILDGEGAKVQPDWLYQFFENPTSIRPWLNARMPTFGFSNDELITLTRGFAAMASAPYPYVRVETAPLAPERQHAAIQLTSKDYFSCFSCHQQGAKKPEGPPEGWAPDLMLARRRLRPDWIITWLQDPQKVTPGTKMPSFFPGGPPDIFGGDEPKQIEVLRDYVIGLGGK